MKSFLKLLKPYLIAILLIGLGVAFRAAFLAELGRGIPYLTFYPTVMVAAILGGLYVGLFGTVISAFLCYYWIQQGHMSGVELLAFGVFLFSCTLMSVVAEAMRRAQEKAKLAKEQAEASNKAKSIFLSSMSHELRTPLNAVLGFSRLMRDEPDVTTGQKTYLDIVTRSGEHLLNLINNILDISKIESGNVPLEEKVTDLRQLIFEIKALMYVKSAEKGLTFSIEQNEDLPFYILVDADKLRRVLINLIGNAIKFTHSGGIILRSSFIMKGKSQKTVLRIEVEDTGIGIPEKDLTQIFTPFVQLENEKAKDTGTGLGLAISKQNIVLMGGKIGVKSVLEKGSLFHFEIPITISGDKLDTKTYSTTKFLRIADGQPPFCILIAEDNSDNRLLLYKLLEPLGFILRQAINGKEAVEMVKKWTPDLVFMDMRMPVLSGIEATRLIKAQPALSKTKVIALTAHALEEERRMILQAGCDDFIRKPYNDSEIYDALVKHLGEIFIYQKNQVPDINEISFPLTPDDFKSISVLLINELSSAVELLDENASLELIEKISLSDRSLAIRLKSLVKNMQYQELNTVLENLKRTTRL